MRVLRKIPAAGHRVILRVRACTGPCTSVYKSINCFFFFPCVNTVFQIKSLSFYISMLQCLRHLCVCGDMSHLRVRQKEGEGGERASEATEETPMCCT